MSIIRGTILFILCHILTIPIKANRLDNPTVKSYWNVTQYFNWPLYGTINCTCNQPCTIICSQFESCSDQILVCPINATCDIHCQDIHSCMDAKIKWPLIEGYGKLTCTGLGACYNTNFPDKPNSTQALTITCGADNVCSESSIYCPKYAPCNVQCLGRLSCSNVCTYPHSVFAINDFDMITSKTNIVWPLIEGYGTLTCSGERACTNLEFPDELISTEPLNIICNNSACPGTTIYCPEYAACNIQCISVGTQFANEYGCNGATIVWPLIEGYGTLTCDDGNGCRNVNYPDKPVPTQPLNITCSIINGCRSSRIYCPESAGCTLNCYGDSSCKNTILYCAEGQNCHVNCRATESCAELTMYCRTNHQCSINCESNQTCLSTNLYTYAGSQGNITTDCDPGSCSQIQYFSWSFSPTSAPSLAPTTSPSTAPTSVPSSAPTFPPTSAPTISPSSSPSLSPTTQPTTCYDLNGTSTNDGYEQPIDQKLMELISYHDSLIISNDKIIFANETIQYKDNILNFTDDNIQQLKCTEFGACGGAEITFTKNSVCVVHCLDVLSCFDAIININGCINTNIICDGDSACTNMKILSSQIGYNNTISIYCGITESCDNVNVTITGNSITEISCLGINACDDMNIEIDPRNYKQAKLNLYAYSNRIIFNNGFGFEEIEGDYEQYITCNTRDKYFEYPISDTIITPSDLDTLVISKYENGLFPCDGVEVLCYANNSSSTASSCRMEKNIVNNDINIDSSNPLIPCYWVPIDNVTRLSCRGNCLSSPTESPTSAPTHAPSTPTKGPTYDPTKNPSKGPTLDPTASPSTEPTIDS